MADSLREVAALPDPVGEVSGMWKRPNGLLVGRVRIPLGVIGFIYESRPNVTVDAAALCLKSGNTVILKGGSEAIHSNLILANLLGQALVETGLPPKAIQVIPTTDREAVKILIGLDDYHRHNYSERRRGPDPFCDRAFPRPCTETLQGCLSRIRGWVCRPSDGQGNML